MVTISRRDILRAGVGLALHPLFRLSQAQGKNESFRFSFFSDTHVGLKNNIAENTEMFREMSTQGFDFGVNGGDVTDYGWVREYANYRKILETVPFKVHHIPGNHDVRWSPLGPKAYKEGTGDPMYSSFDHKGCHFALLDSTVPLSHWGHFEHEMLEWLKADLARVGPATPVFLFTHHWVGRDTIQTDNEAALLPIIEPYNIKLILNAHGHSDLLWHWNDIPNTMNRGLYQLSYERVTVDHQGDSVLLERRTKEHSDFETLLRVPLHAKGQRKYWVVPRELPTKSLPVIVPTHLGVRQYRWDDGVWTDLSHQSPHQVIPSDHLIEGNHRLVVRAAGDQFFDAGETLTQGASRYFQPAWELQLSGGVMSHLRLADGVLYVSAMDGSLSAVDASTGKLLWTAKTSGYCHSSPCVLEHWVVVGSADGNVYAFDRDDGDRVWRTATGGPVYSSAAVAQEILAIASGDGSVYGLVPETGEHVWRYDLPDSNTNFIQSPAAFDEDRFYFGAWDSHLYAIDAREGKLRWRAGCCDDRSFAYSPAIGGPVVLKDQVFVPANGNVLYAFRTEDGRPSWKTKSPGDKFGYSSPCIAGDKLVVGTLGDNGEGRCVDARTGEILWTVKTGSVIYDSGPCVIRDIAVFGSVSGLLTAASMHDGKILGQYRMPTGHLLSTPVADDRRVYVSSLSNKLIAFDLG